MNPNEARSLLAHLLHGIAPEVGLADVDDTALLHDDLDLDSMDFLNLVTALHEETGIDVPERDYPKLATIGDFLAYVAGTPIRSTT